MSKRILVVDDDPDIRQVLLDRLDSYGYGVETAIDGIEAIDALQGGVYDGLLLDIRMPKMSGLEVLEHARRNYPSMPVVMITASKVKESAAQAINQGAKAFILKPFDGQQLRQVVEQWFGRAQ